MHESTRQRSAEMQARRKKNKFVACPAKHKTKIPDGVRQALKKSKVGSFLAKLIKGLTGIKGAKGCGCANVVGEMNSKGPDWCQKEKRYLVDKMMGNRRMLAAATGVSVKVLESRGVEVLLRAGAYTLLWKAIRQDRAHTKKMEEQLEVKKKEKREGATKGRGRKFSAAVEKFRRSTVRHGSPVVATTLPDDVRKNLIYHIYPLTKTRWVWQWNLDQILQRIGLFNGRKIIGIVHDKDTDSPDMVKEYLSGYGCEYIVAPNHRVKKRSKGLGENVTALKLMGAVRSFEPEVTFRAHAKGVTKIFGKDPAYKDTASGTFSHNGETVKDWTEIMYATSLDDWRTVREHLETFAMTGPYRRNTRLGASPWFYSGSFYWYEHTRFYQRNWEGIEPKRYGVESLPGLLFNANEVGCLHGDDCASLYHHTYIKDRAWPEFEEWKKTTVPNRVRAVGKLTPPRAFAQFTGTLAETFHHAETNPSDINEHVHALRSLAERCKHVTEFGTRYGVSTVALLASGVPVLRSYDINVPSNLSALKELVPDGTDWAFKAQDTLKLEIDPTDMLFIDTLHEYNQLRDELRLHGNKARRYLVFHDTVTFGAKGELGGEGLNKAIVEFQAANPHWITMADFKNCNGLRVLRRDN